MRKSNGIKLVLVEWLDVKKTMNDDVFDSRMDIDVACERMRTVGWLYRETGRTLMLVQEFSGDVPRDWVVIPRSLVVRREVL